MRNTHAYIFVTMAHQICTRRELRQDFFVSAKRQERWVSAKSENAIDISVQHEGDFYRFEPWYEIPIRTSINVVGRGLPSRTHDQILDDYGHRNPIEPFLKL